MSIDDSIRAALVKGGEAAPALPDLTHEVVTGARRRRNHRLAAGAVAAAAATAAVVALLPGTSGSAQPVAPASTGQVSAPVSATRATSTSPLDTGIETDTARLKELQALPTGQMPAVPVPYVAFSLPQAGYSVLMPDGRRIALGPDHNGAWVVGHDTRGAVLYVHGGGFTGGGPDPEAQLVAIDPGARTPRVIASGTLGEAAVSPDGTRIAVEKLETVTGSTYPTGIRVVDRASGRVLSEHRLALPERLLGWSASGVVLHCYPAADKPRPSTAGDIELIDPATDERTHLVLNPTADTEGTRSILFSSQRDEAVFDVTGQDGRFSGTVSTLSGLRGRSRHGADVRIADGLRGVITSDGSQLVTGREVRDLGTLGVLATLPLAPRMEEITTWDTGLLAQEPVITGETQPLTTFWYVCTWSGTPECHRVPDPSAG